jgi:hypothetical protein
MAWAAEESPPAYVVPDGYVLVVRDVDVVSGGGAIIIWLWGINDVCKISAGQFTIEAITQHQSWQGRQVLNAGEACYFASDGSTDGAISGYLLVIP